MPVRVVAYNAGWPAAFATAAKELTSVISQTLVALHHIGSTSIPNMWAKPVIDMLAVVWDLAVLDDLSPQIEQLG